MHKLLNLLGTLMQPVKACSFPHTECQMCLQRKVVQMENCCCKTHPVTGTSNEIHWHVTVKIPRKVNKICKMLYESRNLLTY